MVEVEVFCVVGEIGMNLRIGWLFWISCWYGVVGVVIEIFGVLCLYVGIGVWWFLDVVEIFVVFDDGDVVVMGGECFGGGKIGDVGVDYVDMFGIDYGFVYNEKGGL